MKATRNILSFNTSQEAWAGINEYLFTRERKLSKKNQGYGGSVIEAYNCLLYIRKAWIDPEFDFNYLFGYKIQKWRSLVNNYLDRNYLDLVAHDIRNRESKKQSNYNVTIHFSNSHAGGKDCLISCTFQRRRDSDIPILLFNLRASEVTKRFLWDLLLLQRMGEYVYGIDQPFSIYVFCGYMYINPEAFTTYHKHRNLKTLLEDRGEDVLQPGQNKILNLLQKFKTIPELSLAYKSHRRYVRQLQETSAKTPLLVKDLWLSDQDKIEYPDNCISEKQRKEFRKNLKIR